MKEKLASVNWKWLGFFFLGGVILILGKNLVAALSTNYIVGALDLGEYIFVIYATLSVLCFGIPFYFFYKRIHPDGFRVFWSEKENMRTDILIGVAVAAISALIVALVIIPLAGEDNDTVLNVKKLVNGLPLINILAASILLGGIVEEFFFRGHIITSLTMMKPDSKWLPWFAVVLGSLIFGLEHREQGTLGLMFSGIHSLTYGYLFIKRKSLVSAITAHALYDVLMACYIKFFLI